MRHAFAQAVIPNPVIVVRNGREAVEYLAGNGPYADRERYPVPGLMLLDLKMPWMDGFDVLSWLRRQPRYRALPVVVLTSSKLQSDIEQSRLMGVYDYRLKPRDLAELVNLLVDIRKCWLVGRPSHFIEMAGDCENQDPADSSGGRSGPAAA